MEEINMSEEEQKQVPEEKVAEEAASDAADAAAAPEAPKEEAKEEAKEEKAAEEEKRAEAPQGGSQVEEKTETEESEATKTDDGKEEAAVEPAAEAKVDPKKEVDNEQLSKDIKETKEQLQVIGELQNELVASYAQTSDAKKEVERLSKDQESLTKELNTAKEQLSKYHAAEEKLAEKRLAERLSALSKKFTLLGQEKSAEQLSKMDSETLSEFEKVVDAALKKAGDTQEQLSSVEPSQGTQEASKEDNEKSAEEEDVKQETQGEQLGNEKFFKNICQQLTEEQLSSGVRGRARFL